MLKPSYETGLEEMDMELIQIPRIKLVQKTSEEVDDGVPFLSLINSVTKEIIVEGGKSGAEIEIIPLKYQASRLYFTPIDEGGGLLCRSDDGITGIGEPSGTCSRCSLKDFTPDGKPPSCDRLANFFCIVRGYESPLPLVISFAKSSAKEGKKLYNILQTARAMKRPIFGQAFSLKAVF